MKKKSLLCQRRTKSIANSIWIAGLILFMFFGIGIKNESVIIAKPAQKKTRVIGICMVVHNPEKFKEYLGISGIIVKSGVSKDSTLLTCGNKCEGLPVRYSKAIPKDGSSVIVYGKIKKEKGKFILFADRIRKKGS